MHRIIVLGAILACSSVMAGPGASGTVKPSPWRVAKRAEVAAKLDKGLAGTPLRGLGGLLEQVGWQEHLSPAFIAAASGTESSFGAVPCASDRFSIWGLASCQPSSWVPRFHSWREAFTFYARFIHRQWPGATTPYSLHGYSACDSCWGNRTSAFMARLGFGPSLTYGPAA